MSAVRRLIAALRHRRGRVVAGGGPRLAALALSVIALASCERDVPTGAPGVSPRADVADAPSAPADTLDPLDPSYIAPIEVLGEDDGYYVAGAVVARFRPRVNAARVAATQGASVRHEMLLARAFVLGVPAGREQAVAQALARNPNVEFAEPDYLMSVTPCEVGSCAAPSDPSLHYKWDLHNDGTIVNDAGAFVGSTGAADADIDWLEAFDYLGPSFAGAAKIGIVDTGIYPDHPDLAGRVAAAQNFATGYASTLIVDRISHGTHVAGIAAARGHNDVGVTGVAYGPNVKLINAKACELYRMADSTIRPACPTSSTVSAIVWATDQGANVLNLSFGGSPTASSGSAAQQAALQYARERNVLPFCAAGNDGFAGVAFPARFPECVAVGATTWSDTRASYSNYGTQLALAAPGGAGNPNGTEYSQILSTSVDTATKSANYAYKFGTSMATPQAAGLAALLYATGMTSADAVLDRIEGTADDLGGPGRDDEFGYGRINVYRAITNTSPGAPPVAAAGGPYAGDEGASIQFDGSASSDPNGKPLGYAWDFGDGTTGTGATPTHAYADDGVYTVTLTVTDESGRTNAATTRAEVANVAPAGTFATSAVEGRVVVGTPVTLSFADVTDPSAADVAAGITAAYSCGAGGVLAAVPVCEASNVGSLTALGALTDKDSGVTTYGPATIDVERATTVVTVRDATGQYSDSVSLSASLATDAGPGVATSPTGTMEFFVDGVSVGTRRVMGTGAVTHAILLAQPASSHALTARFTSTDANYAGSALSHAAKLTVVPEAATLTYAATNLVAKRVVSPGGAADAFTLVVSVAETQPDRPATPAGVAQPGDIGLAPVGMVLMPVGPGNSVTGACAESPPESGYVGRTYTCSFAAGVPVNTYAVQVSVGATAAGPHFVGSAEEVFTVYDPSLGYTSGGGTFAWPGTGERTTLGFTVKYTKSGSNLQGSLLVVRHAADGTTYRVKSNALDGLAVSPGSSETGYASFSGKATYIEPGWATAKGNVTFTAYAQDGNEPGTGPDGFWLQVSGGMSIPGPAASNAQVLTGGNIVVPHAGQYAAQ